MICRTGEKPGGKCHKGKMLIDSSLIIDFLRRRDKSNCWFYSLISGGTRLAVSVITQAELYAGKSVWEKRRARDELGLIFSVLEILPLSEGIAVAAGRVRALHEIDLIDAIIAASAMSRSAPLATLNPKHFKAVAGLELAPVANYLKEQRK